MKEFMKLKHEMSYLKEKVNVIGNPELLTCGYKDTIGSTNSNPITYDEVKDFFNGLNNGIQDSGVFVANKRGVYKFQVTVGKATTKKSKDGDSSILLRINLKKAAVPGVNLIILELQQTSKDTQSAPISASSFARLVTNDKVTLDYKCKGACRMDRIAFCIEYLGDGV